MYYGVTLTESEMEYLHNALLVYREKLRDTYYQPHPDIIGLNGRKLNGEEIRDLGVEMVLAVDNLRDKLVAIVGRDLTE